MANKYGDIELCLDCRKCVERRFMSGIVVGITAEKKIQVFCKSHGLVATIATDGSDSGFLTELLAVGCESCKTGTPHTHH